MQVLSIFDICSAMGNMKKADFIRIKEKMTIYACNSLEYTDYEDIAGYEIRKETDSVILIEGFHREAGCRHYHWAANEHRELLAAVGKADNCLMEFIPKEWVGAFEKEGFTVRDHWMDYFKDSLADVPVIKAEEIKEGELLKEGDLLKEGQIREVSEVTISCKGQSRGFTGQTVEWVREWLDNSGNEEPVHKVILVEREDKKVTGIVCTGIYGCDSRKGPIAWIKEVAVRPEYQNRGIARRLIGKALCYCKFYGATRAFLAADECNVHAIHLYESIGFCPGPEEGQIDMMRE